MVIFVDTSGWYALLDADDSNHHRAGMGACPVLRGDIPSLRQSPLEVRL